MTPRAAAMTVTPAGLRIGRAHVPPPLPVQGDAVLIQAALLEPRTARPLPVIQQIAGVVYKWL